MGWKTRSSLLIGVGVCLTLLFQNCGSLYIPAGYSTSHEIGGTGLDGMRYLSYGVCANNQVGVMAAITMPNDRSSASLIRQNCADLASPQTLPMNQVQFASGDPQLVEWSNSVFDQQTDPNVQQVTVQFCQSADKSVQASIWLDAGASTIFGSVAASGGVTTGALTVQPTNSPATGYATAAGSGNQMDLNIGTSTLTYSLSGGSPVTVSGISCNAQSVPSSGPATALHIANGNSSGDDGFNLADVNSVARVNALPAALKGLVWLNLCNGADANFVSTLTPFEANPKIYGFFLMSDPDPTGTYSPICTAANLKAESDWIHTNIPGAVTFIQMMNMGSSTSPTYVNSYTPANTDIDYFGLDPFPCRSELNGCDFTYITKAVTAAQAAGIPPSTIVPVYQAFGGGTVLDDAGGSYLLPTVGQEQQILSTWGSIVPTPAFDLVQSWGSQNGDTSLSSSPALGAVFASHDGL